MSTEDKVLEQFEFYFSDSNLPRDKFLRSQVADHIEGYVSIDIVAAFQRVKNITQDREVIIKALKKSTMLELDKDEKMVRRKTSLPETDMTPARTLHVKGIPLDSSIESVKDIFDGFKVLCVRLRRNKQTKQLKGSCFVEFESEDLVKNILSKEFKVKDQVLVFTSYKDWEDKKKKQSQEKKLKQKKDKNAEKIEELKKRIHFVPGTFLKIEKIGKDEKLSALELKEYFKSLADIMFVEYPLTKGDKEDFTSCLVRFRDTETINKLFEQFKKNEKCLGSSNEPFTAQILDENGETEYLLFRIGQETQKKKNKGKKRKFDGNKRFDKKKKEKKDE